MTPTSSEPPRYPQPVAGLVLFAGIIGGIALLRLLPWSSAPFWTPLVALAVTVAAVVGFKVDAKQTLLLRLPSATDFLMAIPLSISIFILEDQMAALVGAVFPMPEAVADAARRLVTAQTPGDWFQKIAVIGFGAAVSEELAFRGFIQTAFLQRLGRPAAVLLTAALFASVHFTHASIFLAATVLGFVALATKSIVVPMFVHFSTNVAKLLLFNLGGLESLGDPLWIPPTILLPGAIMFALSSSYYLRRLEALTPGTAGTKAPSEQRPEPERITIPNDPRPLAEELASLSKSRRRLGWLVVALSMVSGVLVLLGLFTWSVYFIYPERMHARAIAVLERHISSTLEPEAADKAPQISSAFRALSALNDSGQLEGRDLTHVVRAYLELSADGAMDADDADALVEAIRLLVMKRTSPRAL